MDCNRRSKGSPFSVVAAVVVAGLIAGCDGPPEACDVTLTPNTNPNAPLAGILTFTSDRLVVPSLQIDDGEPTTVSTNRS